MIEKIFYNVFVLGSIIGICILPILIFLSKKKYNYNIRNIYKIFLVILLLLFIPFNTFNFSKIKENLKAKNEIKTASSSEVLDIEESSEEIKDNNIIIEFDYETSNAIKVENNFLFRTFNILPYVWLGICVLLLIYNLISYLLFIHNLRLKENNLDFEIKSISKNINLSKKVICKYSGKILTPMTIGLINKKIILPEEQISDNEREHILRHELFHIKNKDIEYKYLLLLLNCIYWFNPIIYNFTRQANDILELNCDENVLQGKDKNYRVKYAETLLNQIEKNRTKQYSFSVNFANRKENIMNRFSNIVNNDKKKSATKLATVLTILVILAIIVIISIPNINFASMQEQENLVNNTATQNTTASNIADDEDNVVKQEAILIEENSSNNVVTQNATVSNIADDEDNVVKQEAVLIEENSSSNVVTQTTASSITDDGDKILEVPLDEYEISYGFGKRGNVNHTGLDFIAEEGDEIHTCLGGEVTFAGWKGSYGYLVVVKHSDNLKTYYAHCSELLVSTGDVVNTGDTIAKVGSTGNATGPHLHLEVRVDRVAKDPMNYLNF